MMHLPRSQQDSVVIYPRGGAVGTEVTVGMARLPPLTSVRISFGSLIAYEVISRTVTDMDGNFTMIVTVPTWAEVDQPHYVLVSYGSQQPRQRSDGFHVTAADGTARVVGEIMTEGGGCVTMRNSSEVLYNLVGEMEQWPQGALVSVTGDIASASGCEKQGIAIAVREIRAV
jgi:hypothetical protein